MKLDKGAPNLQWICFAGASHGELFDNKGRKLLGLAQVRKRHGIAVMMGMYDKPIDWPMLFSVVKGEYGHADIEQIKAVTTCAKGMGFDLNETIRRLLIDSFNCHLLDGL